MPNWTTIFTQTWDISQGVEPFTALAHFEVSHEVQQFRLRCQQTPSLVLAEQDGIDAAFVSYTLHPQITESQRNLLREKFSRIFSQAVSQTPTLMLLDPQGIFRGRWDPGFQDWKEIGPQFSSNGFVAGVLSPGLWSILLYGGRNSHRKNSIQVSIEASLAEQDTHTPNDIFPIENQRLNEVDLGWYAGELHEHTSRSSGSLSPEETIKIYENLDYHFLTLTDHDFPPPSELHEYSPLTLIRGQEIRWHFGHALLLGVHEWFAPHPEENPAHLSDFIHEVHAHGGLFCIAHPFALSEKGTLPSWTVETMDWGKVDLLEVCSGLWSKRFPETLKSFDLWNRLLNRGHRIYGIAGKGTSEPTQSEILECSLKTLVLSEGLSETQLLSALKQGHFYATAEPAISMRLESEYGGAFMGDELRIPLHSTFILYVDISQMERAFLRIISNRGIYCEMPASSVKDTHLKFFEHATQEIRWFRIEIYRYGRPLDELLAFSNPVFVRGIVSV